MSLAVNKYTNALFEIALEENCLDEVYSEFKEVYLETKENPDFSRILDTRSLTKDEMKEIFTKVLGDANIYFLNFLKVVTDKNHTDELKEMFVEFDKRYKEHNNILEATCVTAIELTKEELESVRKALSEKYNKTVYLENTVDESIIGGMKLYVGNTMMDASLKTRLDELRSSLDQVKIS